MLSKYVLITAVRVVQAILNRGSNWSGTADDIELTAILDPIVYFIAFFVVEAFSRASPGKWLLRLRVRGQDIRGTDLPHMWLRALIFYAFSGLGWELIVLFGNSAGFLGGMAAGVFLRIAGLAILCSTMRRSNGFRGLHEIWSGTRVVVLPRPVRRKAAESRRALGKDRGVAARPIGVMKSVGPFRVRGAVRWDDGRKVLSAEDSSLGREAWVVLRPRTSPPPEMARRALNRPTRPRWLCGGEQAEGRWDAYVAPSGSPLADVAGIEGLPWRDARPIIEDLADELSAACDDGTLPSGLTIDQIWVQPDGRALLVDQLGRHGDSVEEGNEHKRALALIHAAAALSLEGGRRRLDDAKSGVRTAIPMHAFDLLARLNPDHARSYQDVRSFRAELSATRDLPTEVERMHRATQLGIMAAILAFSHAVFFGAPLLLMIGRFDRPRPDATVATVAIGPELLNKEDPGVAEDPFKPQTVEEIAYQAKVLEESKWVAGAVVIVLAVSWVIISAVVRGGLSYLLVGMGLVRGDGVRASRWRVAWRSFLVWLPPTLLLIGAIAMQNTWVAGASSWTLFGLAVAVLSAYLPLALMIPARGVHDRLAGTVLVPR